MDIYHYILKNFAMNIIIYLYNQHVYNYKERGNVAQVYYLLMLKNL